MIFISGILRCAYFALYLVLVLVVCFRISNAIYISCIYRILLSKIYGMCGICILEFGFVVLIFLCL